MKPAHRLPSNPRAEPFAQAVRSARTPSALSPLPLAAKNCHHRVPPSTPAFTSDAETTVPHGCAVAQPATCPFPIQAPARRALLLLPLHSRAPLKPAIPHPGEHLSHQPILKAGWRCSDKPIPSGLRKERHRAIPIECLPSALSFSPPTLPPARKAPLPLALTGAGLGCGNAAPGSQGVSRWPTTVPLFDRGGCSGRVVSPGSFSHFPSSPAFARCSLCGRGARSA